MSDQAGQQGLWTTVTAGGRRLDRACLRGELVRVHPGVYADGALEPAGAYLVTDSGPDPSYTRQVRAALLSLGSDAFARGRTAAVLHGWPLLVEPRRTLAIGLPHGRTRSSLPDVRLSQHRKPQTTLIRPVPEAQRLLVTAPLRTVLDAGRELPLMEAVVLADSALRAGAVSLGQLMAGARAQSGSRGARRVWRVIDWADPRSGSVLESVCRVRMRQAGLLGFTTQVELVTAGERVRRVDFCYARERLVIEVDGERWHADPAVDRRRDNALVAAGWRVLRFTWREVMRDWDGVRSQIEHALGRPRVLAA